MIQCKNDNGAQDCMTRYEEAKEKISQQEKEIAGLKEKLRSSLSEELAYLSEVEHKTQKRKKAAEDLLHRLKKYD